MDDKTYQLLKGIADKLGVTTEHLWSVLVNQSQIDAVTSCIYLLISVAVWVSTYKLIKYCIDNWEEIERTDKEIGLLVGILVVGAISLILFIAVFETIDYIVMGLFNPEFGALKYILNSIN